MISTIQVMPAIHALVKARTGKVIIVDSVGTQTVSNYLQFKIVVDLQFKMDSEPAHAI